VIPFPEPRFEKPPAQRIDWRSLASVLSASPGEWAAIGTCTPNEGFDRNRLASYGLIISRVRNEGGRTCTLWACFAGLHGEHTPSTRPTAGPARFLHSTRRRHTRWSWGRVLEAAA